MDEKERKEFCAKRTARTAKTSLPIQRSKRDWGWLEWGMAQRGVAKEEAIKSGVRPCLELSSLSGGASNCQSPTFPRPWRNDCSVLLSGSWPLQLRSHLSGGKVAAPLDFLSPENQEDPMCGHLSRNSCGLWVAGGPPRTFPLLKNPESFSVCPRGGVQAVRGESTQSEWL